MLTVALCKGKLIEPTLELFVKAGYTAAKPATDSRRLVVPCPEIGMTFLIVRPADVPTYVEYGGAVIGIVGKDVVFILPSGQSGALTGGAWMTGSRWSPASAASLHGLHCFDWSRLCAARGYHRGRAFAE